MLALSSFPGEIGGEGRLPQANILSGIEDGIAQIARTSFLHVRISASQGKLPRLVSRGREAGISEDLVWRIEAGEVADLSKDHGSHTQTDARDIMSHSALR